MELRQLQHFLALAELGSFRLAGDRVHVTQQGMSKSIAQFEAQIGAKLFDRDGRSVRLTPVGELLLPYARTIAAELKQFDTDYDAFRGSRSGRLTVGATPTLLGDVIPDVLQTVHRQQPKLLLTVKSGDWDFLVDRLLQGEIDVVVCTEPVGIVDQDVTVEPLCKERNVVFSAREHPLATVRPSPRQLSQTPWISMIKLPRAEADLKRYFRAAHLEAPIPRIRTEVNAFAISWVERTDFLCALPSRAIASAIKENRVVALDVRLTESTWGLVIAYRRKATKTPGMVAFLESIRTALRVGP